MTKADFQKGQTGIVGIATGKVCIELKGESLQLSVTPVSIPCGTIVGIIDKCF